MAHHLEAIIQWMLRPGFYAHPVDSVSLQQTHISLVFLAGPRVYKIKKPVKARFQPADEIPSAEKIVIDTGAPLLENIIRILSDASGPAPAA